MRGEFGLEWRPLTASDAAAVVALRAASEAVDRTGDHYDEADVVEEMADPQFDPAEHTIGGWDGDQLVAFARIFPTIEVRDVDRVGVEGMVHPSRRRCGIGRHILEWSADRAAADHAARHPEVSGEVHVNVLETNTGQVAMVEAAGFEPVRRFHVLCHALDTPVRPAPVPAGLRLVPFDFVHDEATRLARNAAFADHWGSVNRDEVVWRQWFTGQRAFRPGDSFLLIDDADTNAPVAGFVLSYEYEAEEAVEGVRQVWLGQIGVRPAWRGRGAARALMVRALESYREAGYQRAKLDVDTGNTLGALRLYEGTGWRRDRDWVAYARPIIEPARSVTRP